MLPKFPELPMIRRWSRVSHAHRDLGAEHGPAAEVVSQGEPHGDGPHFGFTAHAELREPSLPGQGIHALGRRSSLLVNLLGLRRAHSLAPLGEPRRFALPRGERVLAFGPLLLYFLHRRVHLISLLRIV